MKVEDLMVGDWVNIHGDNWRATLATLQLALDKPGTIKPITLTSEILEKNGFVLDEVIKEYCIYNGIDNRVSLHNDQEYMNSINEWHIHIDSEDYCTIASCELTYVHELQHILRLCKIYKEIVV